jgi:broad specificity phosphatase PhoE
MKRTVPRRATSALVLGLCMAVAANEIAWSQATTPPSTVILVRHAEKAGDGADPGLTEEGKERAQALAHVLGELDIAAVYATPFNRTKETARPLAESLGLNVTVIQASSDYVGQMASLIRTDHVGEIVVVVSHSNTVPAIIDALGAGPAPAIAENEYDDFFVVTIAPDGRSSMLRLRYGSETP